MNEAITWAAPPILATLVAAIGVLWRRLVRLEEQRSRALREVYESESEKRRVLHESYREQIRELHEAHQARERELCDENRRLLETVVTTLQELRAAVAARKRS